MADHGHGGGGGGHAVAAVSHAAKASTGGGGAAAGIVGGIGGSLMSFIIVLIVFSALVHECTMEGDSQLSPIRAMEVATSNCGIWDAITNSCDMSDEDQRKLFNRDPFDNGRAQAGQHSLVTSVNTGNPQVSTVNSQVYPNENKPVAGTDYEIQDLDLSQKYLIFDKVCKEFGFGRDCTDWLTALCLHEGGGCRQDAYNPELAKGDGFASHGPFQIRVGLHQRGSPYPLNEITIKCAYDYECSARWTVNELKIYDYPGSVLGSICHHNGASGDACTRYYSLILAQKDIVESKF